MLTFKEIWKSGTWAWSDGSVEGLSAVIAKGVAEPKRYRSLMPPMGGATLSPAELKAVSSYVWSISHPAKN